VRLGEKICHTPEDFKAWSQNLGHEGVMTTFNSYGNVPDHRQGELITNMARKADQKHSALAETISAAVLAELAANR